MSKLAVVPRISPVVVPIALTRADPVAIRLPVPLVCAACGEQEGEHRPPGCGDWPVHNFPSTIGVFIHICNISSNLGTARAG